MTVDFAFLCDAATADPKLNILGQFDVIRARSFPATHPRMVVVVRLEGHLTEAGGHNLNLALVDDDGAEILERRLDLPFQVPPRGGKCNIITELNGVTFPRPGRYSVEVLVDGRHLKSVPLLLERVA